MSSPVEFSAEGETWWRELSTHFEWSESFELFILFSPESKLSDLIKTRLTELYQGQQTAIHYFAPKDPDTLTTDVFDFLQPLENQSLAKAQRCPIWLEISEATPSWSTAQTHLLSRLNERRDKLRSYHPQPFVIVLPPQMAEKVSHIAPDLWSVRCYSRLLDETLLLQPQVVDLNLAKEHLNLDEISAEAMTASMKKLQQHPTLLAWQQLKTDDNADNFKRFDAGTQAFDLLLNNTLAAQAQQLLDELNELFNAIQATNEMPLSGTRFMKATIYSYQAQLFITTKQYQQAEPVLTQAYSILHEFNQSQPQNKEILEQLSHVALSQGRLYLELGKHEQAHKKLSEALSITRLLHQQLPNDARLQTQLVGVLNFIGQLFQHKNNKAAALEYMSEALALQRVLYDPNHPEDYAITNLDRALNNVASCYFKLEQWDKAVELYDESLYYAKLAQQQFGEQPQRLFEMSTALMNNFKCQINMGDTNRATAISEDMFKLAATLQDIEPYQEKLAADCRYMQQQLAQFSAKTDQPS